MKMRFKKWDCVISVGKYENGNTAIQLFDGEPIAIATVNLGEKLPKDLAYIKDYSENQGMLDALLKAGVVEDIVGHKRSGYVMIPLCRLNLEKLV